MDLQSLFRRAVGFHQGGNLGEAAQAYGKILRREPNNFAARQLLALVRFQEGRDQDALAEIDAALAIQPGTAEALATRGNILIRLGRQDDALKDFDQAIAAKPDYAEALYNRGNCRQYLGRFHEAVGDYSRALALHPDYEPAFTNRGNALGKLGRFSEALGDYDAAIRLRPADALARYHRGNALNDLQRFVDALADYDHALKLDPDLAAAWNNRGMVLRELGRATDALASFNRALALKPDDAAALFNRGTLQWSALGRYEPALDDLEQVIHIAPDYDYARGNLLHLKMYGGDWSGFDQDKALIDQGVQTGKKIVEPFVYQAISGSPEALLACAKIYAAQFAGAAMTKAPHAHRKIRVGYLSGEFRAQATQYLAAGLYEQHDRDQFEITAFDAGESDNSPMRARLERAFDAFIPISGLTDRQAAERIQGEEIDILVNLNGYFGRQRMGVFAMKPAPIQVNYLGFPGSLGAPYMDYILADRIVIPDAERRHFTEQVVWLPDCYQVNDGKRIIADARPGRKDEGLPETGFVFCNFNQSYKLTPETFALWMRLLKQVDGSVLWLMEGKGAFALNLRREAERLGVAGDRLVFAAERPLERHLARLSLADLFLDSLPYNAHTTASDALWAGVPLLTCRGHAFAGRVAASLLTAIGLPELVTQDDAAFEALALKLAREPELLKSLRARLTENRTTCPLFDTDRFRQHIEAAYRQMWEIAQRGEPPRHFAV
ncbi:MAG TPA: tetratricopeptide repeat protein [Rhizomicrobium sp.]|nr:tetratricopeptide repeat protein [Rhizomicrobium sp.]